ncbi:MAG: hypothetical protein IT260_18450, partial [Saprospiraceae bacterium]|nr:hypothetical protein [Saprospiraceae bacterium]
MVKSLLVETLRKFTPDEWSELQLFAASPYFNRGAFVRETQELLAFIADTAPDFATQQLDRALAYERVFPNSTVVPGKMDKVMSELYKMTKEFISIRHYSRPENELQHWLDQAV